MALGRAALSHRGLWHGGTAKDLRENDRSRCDIYTIAHGDFLHLLGEPLHNLRGHLGNPPPTLRERRYGGLARRRSTS
jgi:hypothetical protein